MKIQIKDISKTHKKLSLEVPVETVEAAFQSSIKEVRKKATIKGFRKGKVPDSVLEQYYNDEILRESLTTVVNESYAKALKEHELVPVLDPKFDLKPLEKGKKYAYEAEVEVSPKFELKDYIGVSIKKKEAKIEAKAIEEELRHLAESRAELKAIEGKSLETGLVASIDFEGTIDGSPFKGSSAKGHIVELGRGKLLQEFEDQLLGMQIGAERKVVIKFPSQYQAEELREKEATFQVKLEALYTKEIPKLDDEFAKDLGKESMEVVKKEVEAMLAKREDRKFHQEYANELLEKLVAQYSFDVPEGLVKRELEGHPEEKKEVIEARFRRQFILEAIAKKESIQVNNEELEQHFKYLSQMYHQPVTDVRHHFIHHNLVPGLAMQLVMEKTLDFLVSKATLNL